MQLSRTGAALITEFEGFRANPYQDSVGVWTIGYGSTAGVGPNTPPVTQEAALQRMMGEVDVKYGAAVNALGVPLTQNQFDALTSFVYNVGPGGIATSTGIGRALRACDYARAAEELLKWDKAGGRALAGLTRRRQAERRLFLTPGGTPADEAELAPPEPAPPPPERELAVGKMRDGRLEVFELRDGAVFHRWHKPDGSGRWSDWASLGVPGG